MQLDFLFKISVTIIGSLGGTAVLIYGLSSWLGKVWAARILEKDRLKYSQELEKTKIEYDKQLELYKQELEKSRILFARYTESQFNLYNELWQILCKLKVTASDLWTVVTFENLKSFALHLEKTISSVEKHRLLIEDNHFEQLEKILATFAEFRVNKTNLIKLKQFTPDQIRMFDTKELETILKQNKKCVDEYTKLLDLLAKDFKKQIRSN